jgi:hypothetical protein
MKASLSVRISNNICRFDDQIGEKIGITSNKNNNQLISKEFFLIE